MDRSDYVINGIKQYSLRIWSCNNKTSFCRDHDAGLILAVLSGTFDCLEEALGNACSPLDARLVVPFGFVICRAILDPMSWNTAIHQLT